ncbi:ABC transporter permease [uncultured Paludibaculum sp.]|uniref:ABC transporter permease n=1 Tax=uncultured Paludibaculum sp. TaxID=1765020 RepID=UPI002AABC70D|nr:ABC transporter permease [uncultured Paludibaculum sp.]
MWKPVLRSFLRTPAFTASAIFALALGVGSATAVFSVVDRILIRPLPYAAEQQLVWLGMGTPLAAEEFLLGPDYLDWRDKQQVFSAITSSSMVGDCDLLENNPARLRCGRVESNFLSTLGMAPMLGRDLTPDDDRPGVALNALISYEMFRGRFGSDPAVLGRTLNLDGRPARIAGVLPHDFEFPNLAHIDIVLPQQLDAAVQRARDRMALLTVFGRMKPGLTLTQARDGLLPLYNESLKLVPPQFRKEISLKVSGLRDRQSRDARLAAQLLAGAVLCVLLIACANVANLLLARASGRTQERAVRAALGATRAQLVRESLTGTVILAAVGGGAGIGLAAVLLNVLRSVAPEGIARMRDAAIDWRVALFAVVLTLLAGFLSGLAPAMLRVSLEDLSGTRSTERRGLWLKPLLVTAQFAVTVVLLTGAGLLLHSLWKLQGVPLGFQGGHVLTAAMRLDSPHALEIQERLRRLPGVNQVALADSVPPSGRTQAMIYSRIQVEGRPPEVRPGTGGMVVYRWVTPEYFPALGIRLQRGRAFQAEDKEAIVISGSLAARLFGKEDPLGRRLRAGPEGPWLTVIGIAGEVRNAPPGMKQDSEYYLQRPSVIQGAPRRWIAVIRGALPTAAMARLVREEVRSMDSRLPVEISVMEDKVSELYQRPRFQSVVLTAFALVGILLAGIGLYAVVSFFVAQRTREIGVRMCLGSTPAGIVSLVLRRALHWTVAGAVVGLAASLATTRYLKALLFQTELTSPWIYASVVFVLIAVALAAALQPGLRAARLDPMSALRRD